MDVRMILKNAIARFPLIGLLLFYTLSVSAQTFTFPSREISEIVTGDTLYARGFPSLPDTLIVWCNDWDTMRAHPTTWGNSYKLKSNNAFVKFEVNDLDKRIDYLTSIGYTYRLTYTIIGFPSSRPADTATIYSTFSDTLTISFNNTTDNTPYQNKAWKKYSGFYKIMVIATGMYRDSAGYLVSPPLSDPSYRNFSVQGSIETQHYDKAPYGIGSGVNTPTIDSASIANNNLYLRWNIGVVTPVNYELEWTYVDDYNVSASGAIGTSIPQSALLYNFTNNSTRVWLSSNSYTIPCVYQHGYVVYRVRAVRPDSVQYKYPVYGDWSYSMPGTGTIASLSPHDFHTYLTVSPYMNDAINWQYTVSFAEEGKYKNVLSFYDGLLKNRQTITRFNSSPNKLIATDNVYDYEGRLCIRTLPAPIDTNNFNYQYNVDLSSRTHSPYQASDFDSGIATCFTAIPPAPALDTNALASIYYSHRNLDDTQRNYNRFIPDAQGYPFVETVFQPGYADRVQQQGGAGPRLQIGDTNFISNSYVGPAQEDLNALFATNAGWANFYRMTVSNDANQQLSMSIKDYHGRQMASAMIGTGPDTSHAILPMTIPGATFYKQDLLSPYTCTQVVDTIAGTRTADVDYFNQVNGAVDSFQYFYTFNPYNAGCSNLSVKGHLNMYVTDQCGAKQFTDTVTVGTNGISSATTSYSYPLGFMSGAKAAPYHLHKTLSIYPSDVAATLDSFYKTFNNPICFLQEPYFIMNSVDSTPFPCTGTANVDSTPCSKLKWEMMQQLFPGAIYGQYSMQGGYVVGTRNSIFSLPCPPDTFHVTLYDSVYEYCYQLRDTLAGSPTGAIDGVVYGGYYANVPGIGQYEIYGVGDSSVNWFNLQDTCITTDTFTSRLTLILSYSLPSYPIDSIAGIADTTRIPVCPVEGIWTITTNSASIQTENGTIGSDGYIANTTPFDDKTILTIPVSIIPDSSSRADSIKADYTGMLPSGHTIHVKINFATTRYLSSAGWHYHVLIASYDSIVSGYNAGTCTYSPGMTYRYQDTCTVPSLQDTITINGVFYSGLRHMRTDSFINIYNIAIAAQNYTIAQELLPLHPQYCELQHCVNDSFQTQVTAIPNAKVAESLGLLYLDSLIAHDPIADTLTAIGLSTDSLRKFQNGMILDTFVIMNAYCGTFDSILSGECYTDMFSYEITHRQLINQAVKDYYFKYLPSFYFSNRQRIIDMLETRAGTGCSHCGLARMNVDPAGLLPPPPVPPAPSPGTYDTAFAEPVSTAWLSLMSHYTDTALWDSAAVLYHAEDSLLASGEVDTIMAHLAGCIGSSSALYTNIKDTLLAIYRSGAAPNGNFTFSLLQRAIVNNGVSVSDLCNPYIINCNQWGVGQPVPVNDCKPQAFYTDLAAFLNKPDVINSLTSPGTGMAHTLTTTNSFEHGISTALGGATAVTIISAYTTSLKLHELMIYATAGGDTVDIFLHSPAAGNIFNSCSASFTTASCINAYPGMESASGLINQYTFVATVAATCGGTPTTYIMAGYADSVPTMTYMNNALAPCIPCTQMKSLYNQFVADVLTPCGIKGADHPYYDMVLANYLNSALNQSYTASDYETFMQSCALADSTTMPLYTGYATFTFNNTADMTAFIDTLDNVDAAYSFDNSYRDSMAGIITVCVNLNPVPLYELWKYKNKLNSYPSAHYVSKTVDAPLSSIKPTGQIGFLYCNSPAFNPDTTLPLIIDTSTVRFSAPYSKAVWMGGRFVMQTFYDITALSGTPPYKISQDVSAISTYLFNHGTPGVVFVPFYQSTVNSDYYKPQKQDYLKYVYSYQNLPPYQVVDSIQSQYLTARIPSYSAGGYLPSYAQGTSWGNFTNLYLFKTTMSGRLYDTLTTAILGHANGASTAGYIFHRSHDTVTYASGTRNLTAYICADGSYWYRYFTTGDTLYNVYVSIPAYIPGPVQYQYKEVAVVPTPGDSLNRTFMLALVRTGTDTVWGTGRCDFVIGSSIALQNVLLGPAPGGPNDPGTDTFNNCERQSLFSAINRGMAWYNAYVDSIKNAVSGNFRSYVAGAVSERLQLGYKNQEFAYTLYNYDRAGNLTFTVPPAGLTPIPNVGNNLVNVDTARINNVLPAITPTYTKINNYNYNTLNQKIWQQTIDGGKMRFFYDAAGRMIFSQNAKQAQQGYYTYNLYDHLNRVMETGEVQLGCPYFDPYVSAVFSAGACFYSYYAYTGGGGGMRPLAYYLITPDPYVVQYVDKLPVDSVVWYVRSVNRRDVVMSIYDTVAKRLDTITGESAQQNLRQRISCLKYFQSGLATTDTAFAHYTYATHFSYDIDGNVQTITHDFPALAPTKQRYKRVDYDYDLISGKVNMLSYNRGWPDQFYQRYYYDADNRITQVQTSNDGYIWQTDASYTYYEHGPVARIQEGQLNVQGIDYAYTIQGWLKAMNSDTLNTHIDMGGDAANGSVVAKDAVAWSIDYFTNDYKPISSVPISYVSPVFKNLFNGNISRQTECIAAFQRLNKQYVYDQLNRIQAAAYATINPATNALGAMSDFKNSYKYDMDGNIQQLVRYGNNRGSGAMVMDSLIYSYTTGGVDNKLRQLYDYASNVYPDSNDIRHYTTTTGANRYQYDAIGNTIKDLVNGQDTLQWNLYNKITGTQNHTAGNYMSFAYDGAGNRVAKYFTQITSGGGYTNHNNYYVRDAQGNILAIYREQEVYSTSPAGWLGTAHAALRPAAGGTTPFIHNYVAPYLAPADQFRDAVLGYSLQSGAFAGGIISRPVSYFMSNSPALYHNILFATPAYLPVMVDSEKVGEGDTIIGPALTARAWQDAPGATAFLAGLLSSPTEKAHVMHIFCSVENGSAMLSSLLHVFNDTDSVAGMTCDTMATIIAADSIDAWTLASSVIGQLQGDSLAMSQYMELTGIDSALYADSATAVFMQTSVQYALAAYGDKSKITSFFGSYSGTPNIMSQVTTPTSLLTVAYNTDPASYLDTFTAVLGTPYLDSATAAIPGLSMLSYVTSAATALGTEPAPVITAITWLISHQFGLAEHDFYGSSRLGIKAYYGDEIGYSWTPPNNYADTIRLWKPVPWYSLEYQDVIKVDSVNLYGNTFTDMYFTQHVLGKKQYELTDHLGDVLATISDKRATDSVYVYGLTPGTLDSVKTWKPVVVAAYDYYPFGEYMPTRYTNDSSTHCYNATLPELVHSIYYTPIIPHRALRPAGGATLTDAADSESVIFSVSAQGDGFSYDMTGLTPGLTASATIDLSSIDGKFVAMVTDDSTGTVLGSTNIFNTQGNGVRYSVPFTALSSSATLSLTSTSSAAGGGVVAVLGVPHDTILLENVVTLVCDEDWYRYGHNGQMKNNQVAGLGNWYEFRYREYSPRDIRFKSVDPLFAKYANYSSYQFAGLKPIWAKDLEGLEDATATLWSWVGKNLGIGGNDAASTTRWKENVVDPALKQTGTALATFAIGEVVGEILGPFLVGGEAEAPFFNGTGPKPLPNTPEPIVESPGATKVQTQDAGTVVQNSQKQIVISKSKYPEAAKHIEDAQAAGKPTEGVVDRAGASARRKEALKGIPTKKGMDRDEYPPAVIKTNSKASVRHIPSGDNKGAGASMGRQLKNVPNGEKVTIKTGP